MPADHYALVSMWRVDAPVERVWQVLSDAESWPDWWPFVEGVERILPGEPNGLHSVWRYTWKTMLPYKLRFELCITQVEAPSLVAAAVSGDLVGRGTCRIYREEPWTVVRYEWNVRTCRPWMRWVALLARPIFWWNHRMVMRRGETKLALRLARRV
jgi:uncharacterized protein YndB with AHSA1/START domain